jgi:hypothetical protein
MNSFEVQIDDELEINEQSRVGSMFMARVANEIRRAAAVEKSTRKITQQTIAKKIGTSRAVVNREMQGFENLGARRIAELLWALGWEPFFEARKLPEGQNFCLEATNKSSQQSSGSLKLSAPVPPAIPRPGSEISGGRELLDLVEKAKGAPVPVI